MKHENGSSNKNSKTCGGIIVHICIVHVLTFHYGLTIQFFSNFLIWISNFLLGKLHPFKAKLKGQLIQIY